MKQVVLQPHIISETLAHLQEGGRRGVECVVLWLGRDEDDSIVVERVYRPEQAAGADVFHIPSSSMRRLLGELGKHGLMIAAQVHSHPQEAFHSKADDTWAIVRHVGALSLVLPYFALNTGAGSFFRNVKIFRLIPGNKWSELNDREVREWIPLS